MCMRPVLRQPRRTSTYSRGVAALLVVVFGAGVWVGRSKPAQRPHRGGEGAQSVSTPEKTNALTECRQELAAREKAHAIAQAAALRAEEIKRAAPEMAAEIEGLEKKLAECKKQDLLVKAEICGSANKYAIILTALLHGSQSCVDTAGIADFIVKNYDRCPELDGLSCDWTPDDYDLTENERTRVINAAHDHNRFGREGLAGLGRHVVRGCLEKVGPHE